MPAPSFLTVEEAAAALRVPVATIRYWLAVEKIRGFKPGRRVLIKAEDLTAFVESTEVSKLRAHRAKHTRAAVTPRSSAA